jgi:uncharacterized RDD family membrane protein YckC
MLATIFDGIALWVLYVAIVFLFSWVTANFAHWTACLVCCGYFPLLEGLNGRTVGKALLGIRVVDETCRPPGFLKALTRSLLRLIEVNPLVFFGVPALICCAATKYHQRIGDVLAHTYVVREIDLRNGGSAAQNAPVDSNRVYDIFMNVMMAFLSLISGVSWRRSTPKPTRREK